MNTNYRFLDAAMKQAGWSGLARIDVRVDAPALSVRPDAVLVSLRDADGYCVDYHTADSIQAFRAMSQDDLADWYVRRDRESGLGYMLVSRNRSIWSEEDESYYRPTMKIQLPA